MLTVNFDQFLAEFLQGLQGDRPVVDIGFRTTVLIDEPPDQAVLLIIQVIVFQPLLRARGIGQIEFQINFGALAIRADIAGIGAIAQGESQGGQ